MAKKVYIIENLDCANCAAKIEAKFNAHEKVQEATITFATKQLRLTAEDPDALIPQLQEIARTVEAELTILSEENEHSDHYECDCGHDHHHHGHNHEHKEEDDPKILLLGAALFAAGLILETDRKMKTSFDEPERLLELLVLQLAQEAQV